MSYNFVSFTSPESSSWSFPEGEDFIEVIVLVSGGGGAGASSGNTY